MTPLQLRILLHYSYDVRDYRDSVDWEPANSPAVQEALHFFERHELISPIMSAEDWNIINPRGHKVPQYQITDRGRAMVKSLCEVKLPRRGWMPSMTPEQRLVQEVTYAIMRAFFDRPVEEQQIDVCAPDQEDLAKAAIAEVRKYDLESTP